jgi:hypothetical protein
MPDFRNSPFSGALEMVATLRDRHIQASIAELKRQDELTIALRTALRNGVDINDLSDASGLRVVDIQERIKRELNLGEDMASLSGTR